MHSEGSSLTHDVFVECSRILPVCESGCLIVGTSTTSKNQTQKNEGENDNDLDRREPEFKLSEESDSEVVDDDDRYQEGGDEGSWVYILAGNPVLDNKRRSSKVVRRDDDVLLIDVSRRLFCLEEPANS